MGRGSCAMGVHARCAYSNYRPPFETGVFAGNLICVFSSCPILEWIYYLNTISWNSKMRKLTRTSADVDTRSVAQVTVPGRRSKSNEAVGRDVEVGIARVVEWENKANGKAEVVKLNVMR